MQFEKNFSDAAIKRLPRYYRFILTLQQMGISRVSSKDLGKRMGITSSQIRQDFFNFGFSGLQGYGYDVNTLLCEISNFLKLDCSCGLIIIGAGNLGRALANHITFEKRGFHLIGVFDTDPRLIGIKIRNIEIMHIDCLPDFVKRSHVEIAAITVPRTYAREALENVIGLGIKGIWNFTSVELDVPPDVVIENIQLSDSLIVLGYYLKSRKRDQ